MLRVAEILTNRGIIFINDPLLDCDLPIYKPGKLVSSSTNCLSIAVIPGVNGTTKVTLSDNVYDGSMSIHFDGHVTNETGTLAVVDDLDRKWLQIPVLPGEIHLQVFADDTSEPKEVWVCVAAD